MLITLLTCPMISGYHSYSCSWFLVIISTIFILPFLEAQSNLCRTTCGNIQIKYPLSIDDGCGSPYYRHILVCSDAGKLEFRTPSGRYPVHNISYSDPHILVSDPYMWKCEDENNFRATRPFSLDTSTHFSLSSKNAYLFFNCSEKDVIIEPKPIFCERFPERCDSSCDSASYLCRHLPGCPMALNRGSSCCSYYPKATESLRLMLRYCASYTSVYWRTIEVDPPYDQVPEYGIRVDFDIPITTHCLQCEDNLKGDGTCGFDSQSQNFLCLCEKTNTTTYCTDPENENHGKRIGVIAGTTTAFSIAGVVGVGAGIWYLRKLRATAPVACGVESNENRLF